jgi:uncharacterized membrane protein (DUF373 family)
MERPVRPKLDDEGLPLPPPAKGRVSRWLLRMLERAEMILFLAIALALLVIAIVVFVRGVQDLVLAPAEQDFAVTVTRAVNSVLFIVVVLELLRTIVARLEGGGFQLQPFLVIGIISATRDILTVGAELSLREVPLTRTMIELAVNAGVVVALAVALVLVRRFARLERA